MLLVLGLCTAAYAQPADSLTVYTLARYDSLGIRIIKQAYPAPRPGSSQRIDYYLLANNHRDSISFWYALGDIHYHGTREQCKVTLQQLDGQGQPEIILEYSEYSSNRSSNSTHVFNADSKQRIFVGQNSFFSMYQGEQLADCNGYSGTYTFTVTGKLIIHYPPGMCTEPDHKPGTYALVDGVYTWTKELDMTEKE